MNCPKCRVKNSIKVVESREKYTDIMFVNGNILFGEMDRKSEYTFQHYECTECCATWGSTDDLIDALTALPFEVADKWGVDEVIERAAERNIEVNIEDARKILKIMQDDYDANIGMNWDYLDTCTDKYRSTK